MYSVSSEQMQTILQSMKSDTEDGNTIFQSLELNPYDHHDEAELEFNVVVYESSIAERVEEAKTYPEDYTDFSDARIKALKGGGELTSQEIAKIKEEYIEEARNDEFAEYAIVSKLTDGNRYVYALYFEQVWGQGGLHINSFHGFYKTEAKARFEMNNMTGVIIV